MSLPPAVLSSIRSGRVGLLPEWMPNTLSMKERQKFLGPMQYIPPQRGERQLRPTPTPLTMQQHRAHVLKLYRKVVRSLPRVLMAYEISGGPMLEREGVRNIRAEFEKYRDVQDSGVVTVLRHRAEMEIAETLQLWKTKSHVCNVVLGDTDTNVAALVRKQQLAKNVPKEQQKSQFLTSFFEG